MYNITICLSSDNNYVQHLGATISSVLKNKKEDEFINIYIIDGGINEDNKSKLKEFEKKYTCKIEFLQSNPEKLKNCIIFKGDYISIATYNRLLIPELIKKENRVIYLDCDIIVRKSLRELFNKDFENNLIIGVEDIVSINHSERLQLDKYINGGVILFNCEQMRKENCVEKIFNWIKENNDKIEYHDQDIINAALAGRIKYVEDIYNAQVLRKKNSRFDEIPDPVILHFIGPKKPWTIVKPLNTTHWGKEYFEALKGTPWENFIKEYKRKVILHYPLILLYPTGLVRTLIRNIFSIKNSTLKDKKIITILGIKFSTKRVKRIK